VVAMGVKTPVPPCVQIARHPPHGCASGRLRLPPRQSLLQEISRDVITGVGHDPQGFFASSYDHGVDTE
jgi:hypothetical protein